MNDLPALLHREAVYLWYYFTVQLEQILGWWVLGMVVGSAVSVFAKGAIHRALLSLRGGRAGNSGVSEPQRRLGHRRPGGHLSQ